MLSYRNTQIVIEKNTDVDYLKQKVANQMWDIIKDQDVPCVDKTTIRHISFEDALKELANKSQ
jgi:hypothetical protein